MSKGHSYRYWEQSIKKLKEKWIAITERIIYVLADEEIKISREELNKQVENRAWLVD
jgi:hypothetical protein